MSMEQALARSRRFASFAPEELTALAQALEKRTHPDGTVFTREGEHGDELFFIVSGRVRVSQRDEHGQEILLKELEAGEIFGLVSLIDHAPRSATCTTVGETVVGVLPRAAFMLLHEGRPELVYHFQRMIAEQLADDCRTLNERLVWAMLTGHDSDDHGPTTGALSHELRLS